MSGLSTSPRLSGGPPERAYTAEEFSAVGTLRPSLEDPTVAIGHDVWIGDGVVVMPGLTIGTGAVIGANAVVTRDVAPYAVVAGVPARTIGQRFPSEIADEILASEWWEIPFASLSAMPKGNILRCLPALRATAERARLPTYALDRDG